MGSRTDRQRGTDSGGLTPCLIGTAFGKTYMGYAKTQYGLSAGTSKRKSLNLEIGPGAPQTGRVGLDGQRDLNYYHLSLRLAFLVFTIAILFGYHEFKMRQINHKKNEKLKRERGTNFEEIVAKGKLLDISEHHR